MTTIIEENNCTIEASTSEKKYHITNFSLFVPENNSFIIFYVYESLEHVSLICVFLGLGVFNILFLMKN